MSAQGLWQIQGEHHHHCRCIRSIPLPCTCCTVCCQYDLSRRGIKMTFDLGMLQGDSSLVFECESDGTFVAINHVSHEPKEGIKSESIYTVSHLILPWLLHVCACMPVPHNAGA